MNFYWLSYVFLPCLRYVPASRGGDQMCSWHLAVHFVVTYRTDKWSCEHYLSYPFDLWLENVLAFRRYGCLRGHGCINILGEVHK